MKQFYTYLILFCSTLLFASCTTDSDRLNIDVTENDAISRIDYPTDDGSIALTGTNEKRVKALLEKVTDYSFTKNISLINITTQQYNEIATFTAKLVSGNGTQKSKFETVFNWIIDNIKYEYGDNSPYVVFTSKKGICQGYADLLTIMLHSIDIPAFTINGILLDPNTSAYLGGHAWNYVNCDGEWTISDPTNGRNHNLKDVSDYWYLQPSVITIPVFEDKDFKYNFSDGTFNICGINSSDAQVVIPYSKEGIRIESLNPTEAISKNVKELFIGKNITTLGEENTQIGIAMYGGSIENIEVDPENSMLESYSSVVYRKSGNYSQMYVVAPATKFIEMKPIDIDKESKLKNLANLESIVFVPGTKYISSWAVENCPNLHVAYMPSETKVENNSFVGVASDFKIVRGDYTDIPEIIY